MTTNPGGPASGAPSAHEELILLKHRLTALENSAGEKPWYRSLAALFTALGAVVSVAGSLFSLYNARQNELQQHHAELRDIVQKLGRLPRENFELMQKFAANQQASNAIAGLINFENQLLTRRAADLIGRIPAMVSPGERIYIANAMLNASRFQEARREFEIAARDGRDAEDVVTAYRSLAQIGYVTGDVAMGRENFRLAREAIKTRVAAGYNVTHGQFLDAGTEIRWAQLEASVNNCAGFQEHIRAAEQLNNALPEWSRPGVVAELVVARNIGCPPRIDMPGQAVNAGAPRPKQ
jgi:tetratricopeptide (TPR) repeat protein